MPSSGTGWFAECFFLFSKSAHSELHSPAGAMILTFFLEAAVLLNIKNLIAQKFQDTERIQIIRF